MHLAAVDARQAQVRDDDIEGKPLQLGQRRLARCGLRHLETLVPKPFRDHFPQRIFIVYEKDIWFGIRHLGVIVKELTAVVKAAHLIPCWQEPIVDFERGRECTAG